MAFRSCALRTPTPGELEILLQRLSGLRGDYGRDLDAARALITVGDLLPNSNLSRVELAAYTSLATLLLNLDETITKE